MSDPGAPCRTCEWSWRGRVSYEDGLAWQKARVVARQQAAVEDALALLEHPPVITLGRGANPANLLHDRAALTARGVTVFATGRGGDVTYHGPGQVVGYPILDLKPDRRDVHRYVRDLEEVLIRTAADHGVDATRVEGLTGIWVGREKLAAIGVRISRWVTSHGFAFNVSTDLSYFDLIVPCGITNRGVTSLARLLGRETPLPDVAAGLARHFGEVYDRRMVRSGPVR
ncbi:MAG: lipoyl(octanoyl) transferase LipB [Acidobacteriota bacterium]